MWRRIVFGLTILLALTAITLGIIGVMTSHDEAYNLAPLATSASMGAVLMLFIYLRLRKTGQEQRTNR